MKKKIEKLDIDECLINNGGCHIDANCKNTQGGFNCVCKNGFSGDGFNCTGRIPIQSNSFFF